jgi:hypothetical protein
MSNDTKEVTTVVDKPLASRDEVGRFLKGVSGNPGGRPVGSKNKATVLREMLDEVALGEVAKEYVDVVHAMIREAKKGNVAAAKLVKDIADIVVEQTEGGAAPRILVQIENFTVDSPKPIDIIDGEIDNE